MATVKSAGHHWWPECVSSHWKDQDGCTHWLLPDGNIRTAPPKNFGLIGNGHTIKLGKGEPSPWDASFEDNFHEADSNFPGIIAWLEALERKWVGDAKTRRARFQPIVHPTQERMRLLVECIVSLAVRSPMFREGAVGVAERLRGPLSERERNPIIGYNMRHCQRMIADNLAGRGKIAVLYSPDREFIFGDGFYNTATGTSAPPISPQMLVPLTPAISVLYARPMQYSTEPKLATIVLSSDETRFLNDTVQVYARNAIFYRSQKPDLTDAFRSALHKEYNHPNHPIVQFVHDIPGVPPRDTSWDHLIGQDSR